MRKNGFEVVNNGGAVVARVPGAGHNDSSQPPVGGTRGALSCSLKFMGGPGGHSLCAGDDMTCAVARCSGADGEIGGLSPL